MDVVVIDKEKKLIILAECKSNLNRFFCMLKKGVSSKQPLSPRDNDIRRGKNKVKYLREFNKKFYCMKMGGKTISIMTTYVDNKNNFLYPEQDGEIISFVFAENMANTLFPQGDLASN